VFHMASMAVEWPCGYGVFTSAAYLTSLECFHKADLPDRALS